MNRLATNVSIVVGLLVKGEYEVIESMTRGRQLSADLMRRAVEEYGGRLIIPPNEAWDEMHVVEVEGSDPRTYYVAFPLWTEEEGKSDLTLEMHCIEFGSDLFAPEVLGIHVL